MSEIRSPFLTVEDFISPATCERLIKELGIAPTPREPDQKAVKNERILKDAEYVQLFKNLMQEQSWTNI